MTFEEGDRVELVYTSDEYTDLSPGDTGTVTEATFTTVPASTGGPHATVEKPKIWVDWDDGGKLAMIGGEDRIRKVEDE